MQYQFSFPLFLESLLPSNITRRELSIEVWQKTLPTVTTWPAWRVNCEGNLYVTSDTLPRCLLNTHPCSVWSCGTRNFSQHYRPTPRFFLDWRVSFNPTPVVYKNLIDSEEVFEFPLKPPYDFSQYFLRIKLSPTSLGTSVLDFCWRGIMMPFSREILINEVGYTCLPTLAIYIYIKHCVQGPGEGLRHLRLKWPSYQPQVLEFRGLVLIILGLQNKLVK